jgi:hypothetical protein
LIVAKLQDREARRRWLDRIIERDGRTGEEGGLEDWLRLAQTAGLGRDAMLDDTRIVPGVRFAVDGYIGFCRERTLWEGVAASLTLLQVPDLMDTRIKAFEQHYPSSSPRGSDTSVVGGSSSPSTLSMRCRSSQAPPTAKGATSERSRPSDTTVTSSTPSSTH